VSSSEPRGAPGSRAGASAAGACASSRGGSAARPGCGPCRPHGRGGCAAATCGLCVGVGRSGNRARRRTSGEPRPAGSVRTTRRNACIAAGDAGISASSSCAPLRLAGSLRTGAAAGKRKRNWEWRRGEARKHTRRIGRWRRTDSTGSRLFQAIRPQKTMRDRPQGSRRYDANSVRNKSVGNRWPV
jgi:hypothetical protein